MSARRWVELKCDGDCGEVSPGGLRFADEVSIPALRVEAKERGWAVVIKDGILLDLCPDCKDIG
jgi:hypothetical protein